MEFNTRERILRFASETNLSQIVAFHNDMKRLMQNEIALINRAIEKGGTSELTVRDLELMKDRYLGEFLHRLRENSFLMLFSHLEEWLFLLRPDKNSKHSDGREGLKRFAPYLAEMGVDLGTKTWSFLCNCSDVRDCLLHANRRLSLAKNSKQLTSLVSRKNFDLSVDNDRLVIGGNLVLQLQKEIGNLFDQAGIPGDT